VTRFADLLRALASAEVEFILIGGVAAAAHGSARSTQDLDVVYSRTVANLVKLVEALGQHQSIPSRRSPHCLSASTLRLCERG
jgi:hypothetical protein